MAPLTQRDFERLLEFRVTLRRFQRWSEDQAKAAGLVERTPDREDGRVVRVRLTTGGEEILQRLTRAHLDRLHELAVVLDEFVTRHDAVPAAPGT